MLNIVNHKLLTAALIGLMVLPLTGCAVSPQVEAAGGDVVGVGVNKEFVINLVSSPITGYAWHENYNNREFTLVEHKYRQTDIAQNNVGMNGVESFRFVALKPGADNITFNYELAGTGAVATTQTYKIDAE